MKKNDDILSTSLGAIEEQLYAPCAHDELPWDVEEILAERKNYLVARATVDVDHVAFLFALGAAVELHNEMHHAGLAHRFEDGTGIAFVPREPITNTLLKLRGTGTLLQRLCAPTPGVLYIFAFSVEDAMPLSVTTLPLPSPVS
jgi:hypothetical protein